MNLQALVCCRCGGPLANPEALPALIDCVYCGTVNSAAAGVTTISPDPDKAWDARKAAIAKFTEALVAGLEAKQEPFAALRTASAAHLGVAGKPDTVARIALALARDFEREASVSVVRDAVVLSRIGEAYLLALDELRTNEEYDLNLPFLTATPNGPVHLRRKLTAKLLVELAGRDPGVAEDAGKSQTKKGWWPF